MGIAKQRLLILTVFIIMIFTFISCGKSESAETVNESLTEADAGKASDTSSADISPVIPALNADAGKDQKTKETETANEAVNTLTEPSGINDAPVITNKSLDTESSQASEKAAKSNFTKATDKSKQAKPADGTKPDKNSKGRSKSASAGDNDKDKSKNNVKNDAKKVNKDDLASQKKIVAIDAGHQKKGNYDKEPIGPGAKTKKAKVSSGTQGSYTRVPEYELNLVIAKKVKDELISRGYEVVMTRESNDVDISNKERADIANDSGADIFIRIHADGSTNPSVHGTSTLYPSKKNPYVADLSDDSFKLSKAIVDAICESTGSKNRGTVARDDMSGINWSKIPVTIIEMGYMTNKKEDKLMQTEEYQDRIVKGICDGIDSYFGQ